VLVVVALGGNALLERGQAPDDHLQQANVHRAITALVPLVRDHEVVVTHGNGPQVGVLALESANDPLLTRPYPLSSLVAETQGLIGSWIVHGLAELAPDHPAVALVTRTRVDPDDPAFAHPSKPVGPVYDEATAQSVAAERGWTVAPDGAWWRRVVPSPEPIDVVEAGTVAALVDAGLVVVCAGGGGVPVARDAAGVIGPVDAVIDKDLVAALLAGILRADALLLLTDVDGVLLDRGTPDEWRIESATCTELRDLGLPAGSMGPKVEAACRFVEATRGIAVIARLDTAADALAGAAGTWVLPDD
jgi:carbamate kinase